MSSQYNMSEFVMLIALAKIQAGKKTQFQLGLNKTFCPTPPPLIHRQLKYHQRSKTNKTKKNNAFCFPPHQFFTQSSQY